jgi:histidine kinase-like protein
VRDEQLSWTDEQLSWTVDESADAVTLVPRGELSLGTAPELSTVLRKLLLDRGPVLVDVGGLRVDAPVPLALFPSALAAVGGWPAARLVLFGAGDRLIRHLRVRGIAREMWLAGDRAEALRLAPLRPPRVRRTTELPPSADAAAFARSMVRSACADWSLREVEQRAVLVANELASNAVEHAGGGRNVLVVSADRRGLTVAVRDRVPALPVPGGNGLLLVDRLSEHWGVTEHRPGKTVWAVLGAGSAGP